MRLSEGHRSDMLLHLSGLTREESVMVQASINNERDFDKVADALIIQHPRIHLREGRRRAKEGAKTESNLATTEIFVGFRRKTNTPAMENWEQVPITQTSLLLKITITMTAKSKQQMRIEHTTIQLTLEARLAKKPWTARIHFLLWKTILFSRQLNLMWLLFSLTHRTMILTQ